MLHVEYEGLSFPCLQQERQMKALIFLILEAFIHFPGCYWDHRSRTYFFTTAAETRATCMTGIYDRGGASS